MGDEVSPPTSGKAAGWSGGRVVLLSKVAFIMPGAHFGTLGDSELGQNNTYIFELRSILGHAITICAMGLFCLCPPQATGVEIILATNGREVGWGLKLLFASMAKTGGI